VVDGDFYALFICSFRFLFVSLQVDLVGRPSPRHFGKTLSIDYYFAFTKEKAWETDFFLIR